MKKIIRKWAGFFLWGLTAFLAACSDDGNEEEVTLYPSSEVSFSLFPNDMANNDSASVHLAQGVSIWVHPNASYTLSFDADPDFPAPLLQLFRTYKQGDAYYYQKVRSLEPVLENNRYVYTFSCEENSFTLWTTSLSVDGVPYGGTTNRVRVTGEGVYSDHMSLNLVAVGNLESSIEGFTLEELADSLQVMFRKVYSSVTIDTVYLNRAHEHPTLGSKYPKDEPWVAGWSSSDYMVSELGGWPGIENALDIILVHYIDVESVLGYSNLFSGNMGGGAGSTVVAGAFVRESDGLGTVSLKDIVSTILHETGHFFGLLHTTATQADMKTDASNYEDGLEDTPYCPALQKSGLLKSQENYNIPSDIYSIGLGPSARVMARRGSYTIEDCPDASNLMFPAETDVESLGLSEQQLEIIRKSLMIYPH